MFLGRMVFFRLHESPRYLVHAGRPQEALQSLQLISKFNGSELTIGLADVEDTKVAPTTGSPVTSPTTANYQSAGVMPNRTPARVENGRDLEDGGEEEEERRDDVEDPDALVVERRQPARDAAVAPGRVHGLGPDGH